MANEHSGSSNGNTLILPWQDKIKCRLQEKIRKKVEETKLVRLCFYFSILWKDISKYFLFTLPFRRSCQIHWFLRFKFDSAFNSWLGPIIFHLCIAKCQLRMRFQELTFAFKRQVRDWIMGWNSIRISKNIFSNFCHSTLALLILAIPMPTKEGPDLKHCQ